MDPVFDAGREVGFGLIVNTARKVGRRYRFRLGADWGVLPFDDSPGRDVGGVAAVQAGQLQRDGAAARGRLGDLDLVGFAGRVDPDGRGRVGRSCAARPDDAAGRGCGHGPAGAAREQQALRDPKRPVHI